MITKSHTKQQQQNTGSRKSFICFPGKNKEIYILAIKYNAESRLSKTEDLKMASEDLSDNDKSAKWHILYQHPIFTRYFTGLLASEQSDRETSEVFIIATREEHPVINLLPITFAKHSFWIWLLKKTFNFWLYYFFNCLYLSSVTNF